MDDRTEETIEDIHIEQIKKRSIRGVFSLTVRRIILRIIGQVAYIVLARILSPEDYGLFIIVSFIVNFFGFFSDIGLAAALIQKKEELTKEDLRTTFTVQQILVGSLVAIIVVAAPFIVNTFYKNSLDSNDVFLIQALAFSLLLASLKSIPSVILERKLEFNKLVAPEIVETLIYNILIIVLAIYGYGVWSFVIAVLARGIIGVAMLYTIAPWPIGFHLNKNSFKGLLKFGLPYQLNGLIALIKDNITPTFVASYLGTYPVGLIGWAQKYAFLPLEPMSDIIRVTFPTYSRLQEHPELLKRALEKSLYFIALAVYPLLFGFIALAPWIVEYVFTDKWLPALPVFYLFCFSTFWGAISTTFTNALFAIGKARIVLNYMILWTILTWTLTPILTWKYQLYGIGIASALISFTSIGVIFSVKKYVNVSILENVAPQIIVSVIMAIAVHFLANAIAVNFFLLLATVGVGAVIYVAGMYIINGKKMVKEIKSIVSAYK
jgi:O-antigen/teichoic acid export membrane protein